MNPPARACALVLLSLPPASSAGAAFVTVVDSVAAPVIDRATAAAAGVRGGFETGNAVRHDDGSYHLFYGEKSNPTTYSWKMGWTDRVGHWVSKDGGSTWTRLETVLEKASLWSTMPFFDEQADRWKMFYCNESVGDTRTAVAANTGRGSINSAQQWSFAVDDSGRAAHPSVRTYSISNPYRAGGPAGNYTVFLDHGCTFCVMPAQSPAIAGPYEVMPGATPDNMWPHVPAKWPGNSTQNHSWVENPIFAQVEGGWVATWDYVQGGGQERGTPLPYLGFSWSADGISWPPEQSQLVSVLPSGDSGAEMWTDLVRTPTGLIHESGSTYTLFYAARDTRNTTKPYLNCTVTPTNAPCYWGIGKLTVQIELPTAA